MLLTTYGLRFVPDSFCEPWSIVWKLLRRYVTIGRLFTLASSIATMQNTQKCSWDAAAQAPSSSGPGYLVLIQKIAGSNPAGVTKENTSSKDGVFSLVSLWRDLSPRSGCGVARTRAEACFEHAGTEKCGARYPAGVTNT